MEELFEMEKDLSENIDLLIQKEEQKIPLVNEKTGELQAKPAEINTTKRNFEKRRSHIESIVKINSKKLKKIQSTFTSSIHIIEEINKSIDELGIKISDLQKVVDKITTQNYEEIKTDCQLPLFNENYSKMIKKDIEEIKYALADYLTIDINLEDNKKAEFFKGPVSEKIESLESLMEQLTEQIINQNDFYKDIQSENSNLINTLNEKTPDNEQRIYTVIKSLKDDLYDLRIKQDIYEKESHKLSKLSFYLFGFLFANFFGVIFLIIITFLN